MFKKVTIVCLLAVGLVSCEKEVATPVDTVTSYTKKEVLEYMYSWADNGMYFAGEYEWIKDYPFDKEVGYKSLTLTIDSTALGYVVDLDFNTSPSPYVKQSPLLVFSSGNVNTFGIAFNWNVDEGDYYRVTKVVLFKPQDELRPKCTIEQKLVKKNTPNEVGENLKKLFRFTSQ